MKKQKTQKGITLVALIITIVVLLILAGVAIGTLAESNIIGHAQNAAIGYNTAKEKEEGLLNEYEQEIEKLFKKVGVKAYQLPASMGNGVSIFTPENEMILFMGEVLPYATGIITEDLSTYQITYSNEFTEEEKSELKLLTNGDMGGIIAITEDRNIAYYASIPEDSTNITITKDVTLTHSDTLLAQYYHEDVYYYMPYNTESGLLLSLSGRKMAYDFTNEMWIPDSITASETVTENITVATKDGDVIIRPGSQKVTLFFGGTVYLQDGNLYGHAMGCGRPTRFVYIAN